MSNKKTVRHAAVTKPTAPPPAYSPPSYQSSRHQGGDWTSSPVSPGRGNIRGEIRTRGEDVQEDINVRRRGGNSQHLPDNEGSSGSEEGEIHDDDDEEDGASADFLVEKPLTPSEHSGSISRLTYDLSDASIEVSPGRLYPVIHHESAGRRPNTAGNRRNPAARSSLQSDTSSGRRRGVYAPEYQDDLSSSFDQQPAQMRPLDGSWGPAGGISAPDFSNFLQNTTTESWDSGGRTRQWFLILLIPLLCIVIYQGSNLLNDPKFVMNMRPGPDKVTVELDAIFISLRQMFPSQPERIWKVLKAGVKPLLMDTAAGDKPKYPAIILLVANRTSRTVTCLSRSLGKKLAELNLWATPDCPEVNLNIWRKSLPGVVKLRMDEQTQNAYNNGARCLMLTQLEGIPAEGAKMLHALCDGENAQYPDLVLLMSLILDSEHALPPFQNNSVRNNEFWRELDRLVEARLRQLWEEELGVEEMAAIVSRVANNIVPLTEESLDTLEKVCLL